MKNLYKIFTAVLLVLVAIPSYPMVLSLDGERFSLECNVGEKSLEKALSDDAKRMVKLSLATASFVGIASALIFFRNRSLCRAAEGASYSLDASVVRPCVSPYKLTFLALSSLGIAFGPLFVQGLLVEGCWFQKVFDENSGLMLRDRVKALALCSFSALAMLASVYAFKNAGYLLI